MKLKLLLAASLILGSSIFPITVLAMGSEGGGNWLINSTLTRPHKLYCTQTKMIDRIRCRLNMSPEELAQELSIQYNPEECRATKKSGQADCVARYQSLQTCYDKPAGEERFDCACAILNPFNLIKFRLDDLAERAEATNSAGSDVTPVVNLVNSMEILKQQFNRANNLKAREQIIAKARVAWKQFSALRPEAGADDGLDAALAELSTVK